MAGEVFWMDHLELVDNVVPVDRQAENKGHIMHTITNRDDTIVTLVLNQLHTDFFGGFLRQLYYF